MTAVTLYSRIIGSDNSKDLVILHGLLGSSDNWHTLATIAAFVAVALFHRFIGPGRSARGHGCAAHRSVFEVHVHFDRRVAPAVEDFAGMDIGNGEHGASGRVG